MHVLNIQYSHNDISIYSSYFFPRSFKIIVYSIIITNVIPSYILAFRSILLRILFIFDDNASLLFFIFMEFLFILRFIIFSFKKLLFFGLSSPSYFIPFKSQRFIGSNTEVIKENWFSIPKISFEDFLNPRSTENNLSPFTQIAFLFSENRQRQEQLLVTFFL